MKTLNSKYTVLAFVVIVFFSLIAAAHAQTPSPATNFTQPSVTSAVVIPPAPPSDGSQMIWVKVDWPTADNHPEFYLILVLGHRPDGSTYTSDPLVVDYDLAKSSFEYFRSIPGTVTGLQVLVVGASGFGQPTLVDVKVPSNKKPAPAAAESDKV